MGEEVKQNRKHINPVEEKKPLIGPKDFKIPHVGKKKTIPIDLFKDGPYRGGSLGNKKK